MGEKKVVEEWFLVSAIDGGYERFPFRSLLGLSEYIKKEKEENPGVKTRVIITGGILGFLPGYITKGAIDFITALQENTLTLNDIVVQTKPHLMRIVDNVDEVYYFAGIEDKKNIDELYNGFFYYFRKEPATLWDTLAGVFFHEIEVQKIIQQTEFSGITIKDRLEKLAKEIEKNEKRLREINELIKNYGQENKEIVKNWKEDIEKEKKIIERRIENLKKRKENYEKELANVQKKIKMNKSEIDDCKKLEILLEEVLLKHYIESGKEPRIVEKGMNEILDRIRRKLSNGDEIIKKLLELKNKILKKVEEVNLERSLLEAKRKELEAKRSELDKKRRELEDEIKKKKEELKNLINSEREKKQEEIERLEKESESIQKQLKKIAEEIKKNFYSTQPKYPKTSTTFEEVTRNIRGKSDVGKLIFKLAVAEYLFYLRNVFGRRENVNIILNENNLNVLFQNTVTIGDKKVKVITNINKNGRYVENSQKIAISRMKDEDFVLFSNAAPFLKLAASRNKKGYTFVIGVPPLVDSETLEKELKANIGSKYFIPLSKGLLLPSVVSLKLYENGRTGIAVLKQPLLFALANKRIEEEEEYLKTKNISYSGVQIVDRVELSHIQNKLPSELSDEELAKLNNPKALLTKYKSKIEGEEREVEYYLIGDAHVGGAPVIDLTKLSSEELLSGAGKIVSKDMKGSNAQTKVLVFLGDMIEGLEYGFIESLLQELFGEFERWLEGKKISEETKAKAKVYFAYLAQKRMEHFKFESIADVVKPFLDAISNADKVVVVCGNHQPKILGTKKTTEADLIYEQIEKNTLIDPVKIIKAPGEKFGGAELTINFGNQHEEKVLLIHKYYLRNVLSDPSKHVFAGHFHQVLAVFTGEGWFIQNGALASANAYVIQQGIPYSDELRGFSEVKVLYKGKEEAKVEIQPILLREIVKATETKEIEKAFGEGEFKQITQLINEFIKEKTGIPLQQKKEEFKGLLRFIEEKTTQETESKIKKEREDFKKAMREKESKLQTRLVV